MFCCQLQLKCGFCFALWGGDLRIFPGSPPSHHGASLRSLQATASRHETAARAAPSWSESKRPRFAQEADPAELTFQCGIERPQQDLFESALARELARLQSWATEHGWPILKESPAKLEVVVSEQFAISKSLVPAWHGQAGRMEFPAWRVKAGKAAIMHELTHVLFPNGNRLLAEGLAVYLQALIGSNPAFPNFNAPLHPLARERMCEMVGTRAGARLKSASTPAIFAGVELTELDRIATPAPLTLRVGAKLYGEEPHGQTCIYPLTGSFVQFLIETKGMDAFRALYLQTPLIPLRQEAGLPKRWLDIYGASLADLDRDWKVLIASAPMSNSSFNPHHKEQDHA